MDYPVEFMSLWPRSQAATHATVYKKSQILDTVTVYIPAAMAPYVTLVSVESLQPVESAAPLSIDTIVRDGQKPWLQIPRSLLQIETGFHLYNFTFHDNVINETIVRFLAYIVQDDDPEKPYYYMKES